MKCTFDGCNKELPDKRGQGGGQFKYCPRHAAEVKKATLKAGGERYRAKKRLLATGATVPKTKMCEECGEVEVPIRGKHCPACRKIVGNRRRAEHAKMLREMDKTGPVHIGFTKTKKVQLTDEEIDRINAIKRKEDVALDKRLAKKCGYGNGDPKVLTPAEIAAIAHTLTPPELILTGSNLAPWALHSQEGR